MSLKNTEIFEGKHDFPGCGFFEIFENLDFRTLHDCILYSFFARIFTVATRNCFDEANDGLGPNYIFHKIFDFVFVDFFEVQKTYENIPKSAGNANLPRIPRSAAPGWRPISVWKRQSGGPTALLPS